MKLYVIFGQRHEEYDGQHAPEALEVMDEYGFDENPTWLRQKLGHHRGNHDFAAVEIVEINVPGAEKAIRERLIGHLRMEGTIAAPSTQAGETNG